MNEKAPLESAEAKKRKNRFEQSTITHRGLESHNPSELDEARALTVGGHPYLSYGRFMLTIHGQL